MITVSNLTKIYGDTAAVDNISFSIQKGEVIGLLGPNGAGKTTTLKMLTCYLTPTSGNISIAGLDAGKDSLEIRKKLGYLSENAPVYEEMSVTEYLELVAQVHDVPQKEIPEKIQKVIALCGLQGREHQDIKELSKGYHQRVGLAQSLVHDPQILILDEPTTGLDPNQRIEIRDLIKKIGKEKTVILSSHILSEVEATCDRVMIIHKGKLMAVGTTTELRNNAEQKSNIYLKLESTCEKVESVLKNFSGIEKLASCVEKNGIVSARVEVLNDGDQRKALIHHLQNNGVEVLELYQKQKSLEDIFVSITQQ